MAYKKKEEEVKGELNFSKVLFLQLNRLLQSSVGYADGFIAGVESLEDTLSPYFDEEYKELIAEATEEFSFYVGLDPLTPNRAGLISAQRMALARKKLRFLMALANRKNLLLEKTGEWEI